MTCCICIVDAIILPAITVPPVSVPVSIASDTSLDEVTSVLARISEKSLQSSPQAVSCPQCLFDSDLDNDANLQLIKARYGVHALHTFDNLKIIMCCSGEKPTH